MKIIDAHVHIYPPEFEKERDKIAEKEPWFDILTQSKVHKWCTAEELIVQMDQDGIESSFVTSFAFYDQGLCKIANDYVLDTAKKYPGRIQPLAVISPVRRGATDEIARCADAGAVGIGELFPDGQHIDISDSSDTWRLAAECDERNLFIMIHTAEQAGHQYNGKGKTGAVEAAKFVRNNPLTKVIFAHFGGGLWAYEAMPEMKLALSNTYYDTAAMPWLFTHEIIDSIFAIGAGHKLLYGSDSPILNLERYKKLLDKTSLTEENLELLLYKNAKKLLEKTKI
ncbi:MAG: amidohydrolase family protein [Synergistaceae bacterium]